jgi:hypothetical protein
MAPRVGRGAIAALRQLSWKMKSYSLPPLRDSNGIWPRLLR